MLWKPEVPGQAEKFSTDSRFLSPSRAYTVARAEKFSTDSRFLCLSREVCLCEGAEKFSTDSRFLCLSLIAAWAEKFSTDSRFLCLSREYACARAEKFSTDSRFLSPSQAVCCRVGRKIFYRQQISQSKLGVGTVSWAEKIQNIRHIIDNISVQARRYAVARADKLPTDSRFLCLSLVMLLGQINCLQTAYFSVQAGRDAGAWGREIAYRQQISLPKPEVCWCEGREIACRQQISLPKPGICLCEGREIFYRQHISQSKPGSMLSRGQRNCLQTADFSA